MKPPDGNGVQSDAAPWAKVSDIVLPFTRLGSLIFGSRAFRQLSDLERGKSHRSFVYSALACQVARDVGIGIFPQAKEILV
jgi:hypothetical protein